MYKGKVDGGAVKGSMSIRIKQQNGELRGTMAVKGGTNSKYINDNDSQHVGSSRESLLSLPKCVNPYQGKSGEKQALMPVRQAKGEWEATPGHAAAAWTPSLARVPDTCLPYLYMVLYLSRISMDGFINQNHKQATWEVSFGFNWVGSNSLESPQISDVAPGSMVRPCPDCPSGRIPATRQGARSS